MAEIDSLISLDAFVRRLLGKEGKDNDDYLRYLQIAIEGLRDMYIHDFEVEVVKVVSVNATTNTFPFPDDFVRYTAIATPIDGRWWVYTREDQMVPLTDDDGTTIVSSLTNLAGNEFASSLSTGGGTNKYYFKPDYRKRTFQVSGYTPDIVVLKYVTNGINSAGTINIPDYALLALEGYVRHALADYDNYAEGTIFRLEKQYKEKRRYMRRVHRPTLIDLKDVLYASTGALRR